MDFSIQLKNGTTPDGLALVIGYAKEFTGHRFVFSSGIKVPRSAFKPERP